MIRVYRVESKCGKGFFRYWDKKNQVYPNTVYDRRAQEQNLDRCGLICPLPIHDSTALRDVMECQNSNEYFFGFRSLRQLKNIFPCDEGRRDCRDILGIKIRIYEVDDSFVVYGEKQMVFKMEHSAIVSEMDFYTFKERELKW